jgi:hypoxanthine phosphoribosyltransferase
MLFPMTSSILRAAFEKVAPHISNLEAVKLLVDEIEKSADSLESVLSELESRMEDAEVTFRTDIRILINECRHLGDRTTPK